MMRGHVKDSLSILLVLIIIALVLWFILSRLRIVVFIPVSPVGFLLLVILVIVGIVLVLDHFLEFL